MTLRTVTPPTAEPVTLAEAKEHLRVDHAFQDALILGHIRAARLEAEHLTQRRYMPALLEQVLDAFPPSHIALGTAPVTSILSVKHIDAAGVEQTIDPAAYLIDDAREPCWLLQAAGTTWPAAFGANSVRVRFWAGYAPPTATTLEQQAAVDERVKAWIKLRLTSLYEERSPTDKEQSQADRILDGLIVWGPG
jgi:uncharacterized phiE125 gp8 family phage protein